jgi:Protein of unknown function (DUF2797).
MKLLTYFSFDKNRAPYYLLTEGDEITSHKIEFHKNITMRFDCGKKFCVGGHDLGTHESWVCDDGAEVDRKYEQCKKCMDRTGFNPAFYNADGISDKQAEYNKQAHMLYLAYFDDNNIKVGISNGRRGVTRLLEQGARCAVVLEKFNSANVARQYEAMISRVSGISETLQVVKKIGIINDSTFCFEGAREKLLSEKTRIEKEVKVEFSGNEVMNLDEHYGNTSNLAELNDITDKEVISGEMVACVGSLLIVRNEDNLLTLPIKKFIGYGVDISSAIEKIELPPKQFSLF